MTQKCLICVLGPTAMGKTKLAIELAKYFKTEIISADSRQFYKEMRIGTAVPSKAELDEVPHHFIQHKSIFDFYSVGDFEREAILVLKELFKERNTVILVGGSGLYIDAIIKGLDDFPKISPDVRLELNERLKTEGIKGLQIQLKELDPYYHSLVDLGNPHRLIRALEICIGTGKPYSSFLSRKSTDRFFSTLEVGISSSRKTIYNRINQRVDAMMEEGLLAEVKKLYPYRVLNALQTVGYKEFFNHIDGNWELDLAIEEVKKNTRRFAKRQLTWFRKKKDIHWFEYDAPTSKIVEFLSLQIQKT